MLSAGTSGTFVELGAFDGIKLSNTLVLERCFNWTGLLIEAVPENFRKLRESGRSAAMRHSAVCKEGGSVMISSEGEPTASNTDVCKETFWRHCVSNESTRAVRVPCTPLNRMMSEHGLGRGATFLSLDVEGSEALVLETVDPSAFRVVLVEFDGSNPEKEDRVHELLSAGGLILARELRLSKGFLGGVNRVYIRRDSADVFWSFWRGMDARCDSHCGNTPAAKWLDDETKRRRSLDHGPCHGLRNPMMHWHGGD